MATTRRDRPRRRHSLDTDAPLYDARYEHDACGVGFVADAGGRSRDRVLPLALAGLAALGHRGAFGADGESSDGAGVAPAAGPLPPGSRSPAISRQRSPAIVLVFLPRGRTAERRGRRLVERGLRGARPDRRPLAGRAVRRDRARRGGRGVAPRRSRRRSSTPSDRRRPGARSRDDAFERRLVVARRRARDGGPRGPGAPGGAVRPVGVVPDDRLQGPRHGRPAAAALPGPARAAVASATRSSTSATPPTPTRVWGLAQPFRLIAHNGEINTVRGNREQVRGRTRDRWREGRSRPSSSRAGPLLSPDGSDSLSLDEALELLMATGWELTPALLAAIPEALALRRSPHPHVATLRRRTAGFLAPWDGPAAIVFADGVRVGAHGRPQRPATGVVRGHPRPAGRRRVRGRARCRSRRPRRSGADASARASCCWSSPAAGAILEDAEAKTRALRALPIHDAPTADPRGPAPRRPRRRSRTSPCAARRPLRHLAGLDAERARLDIKTMALEGHEPLWSMGDDTPTPGRGRLDRPVADHLRQAFAQVTNPAIDPERERIVMDLRVELGRRPALLGGPPRGPRTLRLDRPIVADLDGPARRASAAAASGVRAARRDVGRGRRRRPASRRPSSGWRRRPSPPSEAGVEVLVLSDDAFDLDRLPVPSILAAGAVHTALTEAGLRGRTDIVVDAADVLDVHAMAMLLAVGATRRPSAAGDRAGGRAGRHARRRGGHAGRGAIERAR